MTVERELKTLGDEVRKLRQEIASLRREISQGKKSPWPPLPPGLGREKL